MPTVSVKLPDATKARLDRLALAKGTSPHALMVEAIKSSLESEEKYGSFVEDALRARDEMVASGKAYDGDEMVAYARARLRGENPVRPQLAIGRPAGKGLRELVISRGSTGYLALYAYDEDADAVSLLAIRHQPERAYRAS